MKEPTVRHTVRDQVEVTKHVLDNGLTLIIWEDHQAPVVAYQTWFAVGSGHEREGRSGMAHLFEHLMFKETKNMAAGEFDRLLETNGVSTNAATWLDWTYYRENLPADKLDLVMRLEADRMQNMILNQEQLDTEREVVKNERRLRVDNDPEGKLFEVLFDEHFGSHPYGHPTIGWMEDISAITLADCLEFYKHYYAPNNAAIVIVGDVRTEEVLRLAERYYGDIPSQTVPSPPAPSHAAPPHEQQRVLELAVATPRLTLVYTGPEAIHPDGPVLTVLNEILFNSESGRIRKLLVEDEELVVDLGGFYSGLRVTGLQEMQLNLVPGADWRQVLALVDRELEALATGGCTHREVAKGRNRREMSYLRSNLSVSSRARNLGHHETSARDFSDFFAEMDRLTEVTREDVQRAAARWLDPAHRTVVVAVPPQGKKT